MSKIAYSNFQSIEKIENSHKKQIFNNNSYESFKENLQDQREFKPAIVNESLEWLFEQEDQLDIEFPNKLSSGLNFEWLCGQDDLLDLEPSLKLQENQELRNRSCFPNKQENYIGFKKDLIEQDFDFHAMENIFLERYFGKTRKYLNLNLTESKFLEFLVNKFFQKRQKNQEDGFYQYYSDKQILNHIGWKSRTSCYEARKGLIQKGLLEVIRKRHKGKNHYKLNYTNLIKLIIEKTTPENKYISSYEKFVRISKKAYQVYKTFNLEIKNEHHIIRKKNIILSKENIESNAFKNIIFGYGDHKNTKIPAIKFLELYPGEVLDLIHRKLPPNSKFSMDYYKNFANSVIKNEPVTLKQFLARCVAWAKREKKIKSISQKTLPLAELVKNEIVISRYKKLSKRYSEYCIESLGKIFKKIYKEKSEMVHPKHFLNFCLKIANREVA